MLYPAPNHQPHPRATLGWLPWEWHQRRPSQASDRRRSLARGLAAARTLADHDVEVTVVEARNRLGGRCWTRDGIDFGAHWIHGTEGNPLPNLAAVKAQLKINS
jgi:hypothetical protein